MNEVFEAARQEIARLKAERDLYEENMKKSFMRGVCALNMEAMSMFKHSEDRAYSTGYVVGHGWVCTLGTGYVFKYGEDRAYSTGYVVGLWWVCTSGYVVGLCSSMERIGQAPLGMWLDMGGYVL